MFSRFNLLTTICHFPLFKNNRLAVVMDKLISQINDNHSVIVNRLASLEEEIKQVKKQNESGQGSVNVGQGPNTSQDVELLKKKLREENGQLKEKISDLVKQLNALECKRLGNSEAVQVLKRYVDVKDEKEASSEKEIQPTQEKAEAKPSKGKPKEPKEPKANKPKQQAAADDNKPLDVSRLDLRVGRIVSAEKHPDADALYVEQIDCGEEKPRTVVSGLVRFVPLEQMQNRMVVVLCNLKPAKMRGVTSEAMVMCASTPDKVEILAPPEGSLPGERVTFLEYPGEPDAQLNPKKKIWEQIAPDLKTDNEGSANYKGSVFRVGEKGVVKSETLKGVQVK